MNWDALLIIHTSFLRSFCCVCLVVVSPNPRCNIKEGFFFSSKFRVIDVIKIKNSSTICRLHYVRTNFHNFMWGFVLLIAHYMVYQTTSQIRTFTTWIFPQERWFPVFISSSFSMISYISVHVRLICLASFHVDQGHEFNFFERTSVF